MVHRTIMLESNQRTAIPAPYPGSAVPACRYDPFAIREELCIIDPFCVADKSSFQMSVGTAPYAGGVVLAGGDDVEPIGRKRRGKDCVGVALQDGQQAAIDAAP